MLHHYHSITLLLPHHYYSITSKDITTLLIHHYCIITTSLLQHYYIITPCAIFITTRTFLRPITISLLPLLHEFITSQFITTITSITSPPNLEMEGMLGGTHPRSCWTAAGLKGLLARVPAPAQAAGPGGPQAGR
jgi:hypothetical protein